MEEQKTAEGALWTHIINVGRAIEKLNVVLDNEIFDNLSSMTLTGIRSTRVNQKDFITSVVL